MKLVDNLLLVGCMQDDDLTKLLIMIDPETWDPEYDKGTNRNLGSEYDKGTTPERQRLRQSYVSKTWNTEYDKGSALRPGTMSTTNV